MPDSTEFIEIHELLNRYPIAVDTKRFDILDSIFSNDVRAEYSTIADTFSSLDALKAGLAEVYASETSK